MANLEAIQKLIERIPEIEKSFYSADIGFFSSYDWKTRQRKTSTMPCEMIYKSPNFMAWRDELVCEEELLASWKEFFGTGTNWKDLDRSLTYKEYLAISDRDHVKKIMQMPVHFLQESGKGFFVKKEGYALALREELENVIHDPAFVGHVKDVIDYRTMDYYQRRYAEQEK